MANTLVTPTKIAKEGIMLLKNRMGISSKVHRDYINEMYDPKSGGAVTIRNPVEYTVTSGATLSNQDTTEYTTVISAPTQKHVGFRFSSQELTLTIEEFSKRYIAPAVTQLVNDLEVDLLGLYNQFPHTIGLPGTTPNAWSYLGNAMQRLDDMGCEPEDRCLALNPAACNKLSDALKGLFIPNMTEDMVRKGYLGSLQAGFDVFKTQNVNTHTLGTFTTGSTPLTNGASSAGDKTIVTDGWANSTLVLKAGDVFTVGSVNEVNPRNKQNLGFLKQFVAQSDVTSDGSGNATITVMDSTSSGLHATGAYQNCSALPADGATITPWGATSGLDGAGSETSVYDMNLAFHKNAIALVFFNIETPASADGFTAVDPDTGLALRAIRDYDVTNDREVYRLDILRSMKVLDPNRGARLVGA